MAPPTSRPKRLVPVLAALVVALLLLVYWVWPSQSTRVSQRVASLAEACSFDASTSAAAYAEQVRLALAAGARDQLELVVPNEPELKVNSGETLEHAVMVRTLHRSLRVEPSGLVVRLDSAQRRAQVAGDFLIHREQGTGQIRDEERGFRATLERDKGNQWRLRRLELAEARRYEPEARP